MSLVGRVFSNRYEIEREVVALLARWMLAHVVSEGRTIEADWHEGKCVFS